MTKLAAKLSRFTERVGLINIGVAPSSWVGWGLTGTVLVAVFFSLFSAAFTTQKAEANQPAADLQTQTYEGVISDSHCGAKHSSEINKSAADCTRVCVHAGEQFVLIDGEAVYTLDGDPLALKRAAGERVKIIGTLSGARLSINTMQTE